MMDKTSKDKKMDELRDAVSEALAPFLKGLISRKELDGVLLPIFEQAVLGGVIDLIPKITIHAVISGAVH